MLSQIQDALNVYLIPLIIVIPIAIVLYLLASRRDNGPPSCKEATPIKPDRLRARPTAAPAGRAAPVMHPGLARSPGVASAVSPSAAPAASARVPLAAALAAAPKLRPPLPAHPPPVWDTSSTVPLPGLAPDAPASPARLLLVDDSAVARAKLRRLFETAGYTTDQARDGLEALALLGKGRYALMITDLEMPNMNGIELIAAVNASLDTEAMPILAITGHDDLQAMVHECQGLFGIFKKPWNDQALLRRVQALARLHAADAAPSTRH